MDEEKGKVLATAEQNIVKELQHEFLDFLSKVQIDLPEQFQSQLLLEIPFSTKYFQNLKNSYKSFPADASPKFMNSLLNYQNDVIMGPTFNEILVLKVLYLIAESIPKRENSKFLSAILTQMIFESCLKTPDFSELFKAGLSLLTSYSKDGIDISSIFFHRLPNFLTHTGADIQYYFKFLPTVISTPNAFYECISFLATFYEGCKTAQKDLRPIFYKHTCYFLTHFSTNFSTVRQQLLIETDQNAEKSLMIYQFISLIIDSGLKDVNSFPILAFLIPLCTTQFINQMNLKADKKKKMTISEFINAITNVDKKKIIILYHVLSILFTSILVNPSIPFPEDVKDTIRKKFISLLDIKMYESIINKELGTDVSNTEDSFDQYSKKRRVDTLLAALPLLESISNHFASCPILLHLNQNAGGLLSNDILFCKSVSLIFNGYPFQWQKKNIPIFVGKRLIDITHRTLNEIVDMINNDPQRSTSQLKSSSSQSLTKAENSTTPSPSSYNPSQKSLIPSSSSIGTFIGSLPMAKDFSACKVPVLTKSSSHSFGSGTLSNPQSDQCLVVSRIVSSPSFALFSAIMNALFPNISEIQKQVSFDSKQTDDSKIYFEIKDTPLHMQILIEAFHSSNDLGMLSLVAFDLLKHGIDFPYIFTFLQNLFLPYKKWESILGIDDLVLFELISLLLHDLYDACFIFIKLNSLLSLSYLMSFYDTFLSWIYLILSNAKISNMYNTQILKIVQTITDLGSLVLAFPSESFDDKINKSYSFRDLICIKWKLTFYPAISDSTLKQLLHLAFTFIKKEIPQQNAFRIYFKNVKFPQHEFVRLTLKRLRFNQITDSILPSFHSIPSFFGPPFFTELLKLTEKMYFNSSKELLIIIKFAIILVSRSEFLNDMMTLAYNFVYLLQVNQFRDDEAIITNFCEYFQALFTNHKITDNYHDFVYLLCEELPYFSVQKKKTIVSAILNAFNSILRSVQFKNPKLISFVFMILENCYYDFIEDKHIEKSVFALLTNLLMNNFHFGYSMFFDRMKKCDIRFRKMLMIVVSTTFDSQKSLKNIQCIDKLKNVYVIQTPQFVLDFRDLKFSSVLYFESIISFLSFYNLENNFLNYMTDKSNRITQKTLDNFFIAQMKHIFFDLDFRSMHLACANDNVHDFVNLFKNNCDFIQLNSLIGNSLTKIELVIEYLLIPFLVHPVEYGVNSFSDETKINAFIEKLKLDPLFIEKVNDEDQPIIERNHCKINYSKSLKQLSLFYKQYAPVDQFELENTAPLNFLPQHYIQLKRSNFIYPLNETTWMISVHKFLTKNEIDSDTISKYILMHFKNKDNMNLICDFVGCTNSMVSFLQIDHFSTVIINLTEQLISIFNNIYFHHTPAYQLQLCDRLFLQKLRNKITFINYFSSISPEFQVLDPLTTFSINLDYESSIQFNKYLFDVIVMRPSSKGKLPVYYSFQYSSIKSIVAENNKLNILINQNMGSGTYEFNESSLTNIPKLQPNTCSVSTPLKPMPHDFPRNKHPMKKAKDTFMIQLQLAHCEEIYKLLHWKQECTRTVSQCDQLNVLLRPFSPEFLVTQSLMYLTDPIAETQTYAFYIFNIFITEISKKDDLLVSNDNPKESVNVDDDNNNEQTMKRSPSKTTGLNIFYSTKFHADNCLCPFKPNLLLVAESLLEYSDWENIFYDFLCSFLWSASVQQLNDYSQFLSYLSNHLTNKLTISKIVNLFAEFHNASENVAQILIDVFWPFVHNKDFILISLQHFFSSSLHLNVKTTSRIVSILTMNDTSILLTFLTNEKSFLIVQNAILGHMNLSDDLYVSFFLLIIENEIRNGEFLKSLIYIMSMTRETIRHQYEIIKKIDEFHSSSNFLIALEVIVNCCYEINQSDKLKEHFEDAEKPYQLFARSFLYPSDRNIESLVYQNLKSIKQISNKEEIYEIIEISLATLDRCYSTNPITNFWISVFALQMSGNSLVIPRIQSTAINVISSLFRKDSVLSDTLMKRTFRQYKGKSFLTPFEELSEKLSQKEVKPFAVFLLKIFSPLLQKVNSTRVSLEFFRNLYESQNLSNENAALIACSFIAFNSNSPFSSQVISVSKCILCCSKSGNNRVGLLYNNPSVSSDSRLPDLLTNIDKKSITTTNESSHSFGSVFNSPGNIFSSFGSDFGAMMMLSTPGKPSYAYELMKKAEIVMESIDFFVLAITIPHANPQMNDIVDFFIDVLKSEKEIRRVDTNYKSMLDQHRCQIIMNVLNNFVLRENNMHLCKKCTTLLTKIQKMMSLNQVSSFANNELLFDPLNWSEEKILTNIESLLTQ